MSWTRPLGPALLALLAACGDSSRISVANGAPETHGDPVFGGTAVVGIAADLPDLNPLTSIDAAAENVQRSVLFTPLIRFDERMEPTPGLARAWSVNADTSEITFHLRDDVYFHDGVKTTAWDVKLFYDLARTPETGYPNTNFFAYYGEASAPDSFTFRVRMRPHVDFMDSWRRVYGIPRHVLESVPPGELRKHPFSTREPLGNGPFRFVSHAPGQSWRFEANPRHPAELGGRPYLDAIVLRVIPEPSTAVDALLKGEIDYLPGVGPDQARRLRESSSVRLISYPGRTNVYISWNQRRPPLDDVRVRRALTQGINRPGIIEGVLFGYGQLANSTIPPFHWAHDSSIGEDLAYDPEAARALLAEAGWQDRDGDGIVESASGRPLRLTFKTNQGSQIRKAILEVVQSDLGRIGVDARIELVEWGTLLSQVDGARRDFDGLLIGWVTEFRIDDRNLFHCDSRELPFNRSGYCDPRTDRLLDTLQVVPDRQAARPLWRAYQQRIAELQPYTFLYFAEILSGAGDRLRNVRPDARGDWIGADRWWIAPTGG